MRGANHDLEALGGALGAPALELDSATWIVSNSSRIFAIDNPLPAPGGCASTMLQREAQLRIDQIRAHLNVFGLHDEYVPSSRFHTLGALAATLADRSAYFNERYVDFLGRGEAEVLDELDTAFMQELSAANEEIARNRVAAAQTELEAAQAAVGAAVRITDLSQAALADFRNSYSPGFVRMLNSVGIGLPPSVSLGGFVGSISGADGYDAQFNARENEMAAAVEHAVASAEAAGFRVRLAEIEKLVAQESRDIEQARGRHLEERLNFLRNRVLNATFWYQTSAIYRVLAETQVRAAGRYAWMAERALEFETNLPAAVVRMDYHLIPLGAERLRADIDRLRALLVEFRERYRDIPNVVEREFRFSVDFPDQFRALTVNDALASQAAESLGPGVRAVEFRTAMRLYDERLPGRYAFGRVLGVEVELHTDVSPGVFTGHVENCRVISVAGQQKRVQVSESWVRVPAPEQIEGTRSLPTGLRSRRYHRDRRSPAEGLRALGRRRWLCQGGCGAAWSTAGRRRRRRSQSPARAGDDVGYFHQSLHEGLAALHRNPAARSRPGAAGQRGDGRRAVARHDAPRRRPRAAGGRGPGVARQGGEARHQRRRRPVRRAHPGGRRPCG